MLTDTQKHQFETLGLLHLPRFFPPDAMQTYINAFDETLVKANGGQPWTNAPTRQQVVPFYRHNTAVYHHLLDNERLLDVVEDLLGEDFVFAVSEGIHHYGGTGWHHDDISPPGQTHLKVVFFMDPVRANTGCLTVLPGSHFPEYRERMERYGDEILSLKHEVPGVYPIESDPGDAVIFNVALYHAAFGDNTRRGIYLNFFQKPTTPRQEEHVINLYNGDSGGEWVWYTPELFEDAKPRRMRMLSFLHDRCYNAG